MRVTFIIYDGVTTLDFIGVYGALTRLKTMSFEPDFAWDVRAKIQRQMDNTPGR